MISPMITGTVQVKTDPLYIYEKVSFNIKSFHETDYTHLISFRMIFYSNYISPAYRKALKNLSAHVKVVIAAGLPSGRSRPLVESVYHQIDSLIRAKLGAGEYFYSS